MLEIIRARIKCRALEGAHNGGFESPVVCEALSDICLDLPGGVRIRGRAVAGGEFQALILSRIVAGGHVYSSRGAAMADGVGDYRRRSVAVAKQRGQAIARQHFSGSKRELAAQETRVVTHDHGLGGWMLDTREIIGDTLGRKSHVIEGKIAGYQSAPTGGAKFDHRSNLLTSQLLPECCAFAMVASTASRIM